ncbi:MAG: class I SAM-dependent methyltransferase, partial [Candidatus Dormibacteraceae bacterium]
MDYAKAVELAPPGWRHFGADDIDRLPEAVKRHEMARVPAHERALIEDRDTEAGERLLRAMFWTLVYHLEPERWDELAQAEPVHPDLLRAFPSAARVALDIGAGSGRLTRHLLDRASRVVAVEPAGGLRARLLELCPTADAVAGWAEALPLTDGCSQLTAA